MACAWCDGDASVDDNFYMQQQSNKNHSTVAKAIRHQISDAAVMSCQSFMLYI